MSAAELRNTMIWLIGFPGVGKYTIAKEIARQADFVVVDNHLINNPVFALLKADGKTPLPPEVWDYVGRIRDTVMEAVEKLSPRHFSFVLTNVMTECEHEHLGFKNTLDTFERRGSHVVPILLTCAVDENARRITSRDRAVRMKDIDPATPTRYQQEEELIRLSHPNILQLDVTSITPARAAEIILRHAAATQENLVVLRRQQEGQSPVLS